MRSVLQAQSGNREGSYQDTQLAQPVPGKAPRKRGPEALPSGPSRSAERRWRTVLAASSIVAILTHIVIRYFFHFSGLPADASLFLILIFGGVPLVWELATKVIRGEFGSDLLAGISIVTAAWEREYLVAAIVVLMLSGGAALEAFAARRASSVLNALAKRMPQIAHRREAYGMADVKLDDLRVGDLAVIYPHEVCPADGIVVEGQGRMNEAFLTGEPFELDKTPGSSVISGALNRETALTMRVEKLAMDSRYARIMRVMGETQQHRPKMRRLGDHLGAWYTPLTVGIAVLAWLFSGESHRFLAVLVIATPCPLLIAIPVAVIGAISLSARRGIIVKNPAILEQIDSCRTAIFDKTGTLTYGQPSLTEIACNPGFEETSVLRLAASVERYSKHPLALAILEAAKKEGLSIEAATEISEPPGQGLTGVVRGVKVLITGRKHVEAKSLALPAYRAGLECLVFLDDHFAALLRFHDSPRQDGRTFVKHLSPRHNFDRILLVSGDRDEEARYLADEVGIREVFSGRSPEEKVQIVRAEALRQKTLFVGDGINDAPAMQAASVGVGFGQSSDIMAEAADAVVLESSLGKVDELIHIGRRMRRIALQSAVGGMALSLLGMAAAAFGFLPAIGGAIAQEAIDLVAVLNAVRVAMPFKALRDF